LVDLLVCNEWKKERRLLFVAFLSCHFTVLLCSCGGDFSDMLLVLLSESDNCTSPICTSMNSQHRPPSDDHDNTKCHQRKKSLRICGKLKKKIFCALNDLPNKILDWWNIVLKLWITLCKCNSFILVNLVLPGFYYMEVSILTTESVQWYTTFTAYLLVTNWCLIPSFVGRSLH
jgi:hypothetical protein